MGIEGWAEASLGELTQPIETVDPTREGDYLLNYFDISSIDNEAGVVVAPKKLKGRDAPSRARQVVYEGDVLFSTVRPGLKAIAQVPPISNTIGSTAFCVLRATGAINPKYLFFVVRSDSFLSRILPLQRGVSYPAVRAPDVLAQKVMLPPLNEQVRIVDLLEECFSELDAGVAELKAAQQKLAKYRQSLLIAAFTGYLSAAWRGAGRAQISDGFRGGIHGSELPNGWSARFLGELISDGPQNGLYLPASRYGRGQPILRIDDFQSNWHRARHELKKVDVDESTRKSYCLRWGDLVINRVNSMTHLGKLHVVKQDLEGILFESNMMRLRLTDHCSTQFIGMFLSSAAGRAELLKNAKWAVNQASINQQDVKNAVVPLPSRNEQDFIVEQLEQLFVEVDRQSSAIDRCLKQAAAQRQNILKSAFSGQLVPQDPADEPASVLLERIRAERATRPAKKAPRPRKSKAAA